MSLVEFCIQVKIFTIFQFSSPSLHFMWYYDSHWSKLLCSTIQTLATAVGFKVTYLEFFNCALFYTWSYWQNHFWIMRWPEVASLEYHSVFVPHPLHPPTPPPPQVPQRTRPVIAVLPQFLPLPSGSKSDFILKIVIKCGFIAKMCKKCCAYLSEVLFDTTKTPVSACEVRSCMYQFYNNL